MANLPYAFLSFFGSFEFVKEKANDKFVLVFGERVRQLRLERGLTLHKLANDCDVEYSQISRIERGVINTRISMINTLANALNVDFNELLNFDKIHIEK